MLGLPKGFRFAGVASGIKRDATKLDLSLIVSDLPATAAGVYTRNLVYAAPVALDRQRTPTDSARVVVANSGNANACTGERGLADAREMARLAAAACGASADQALVLSTGVIGVFLPMETIARGIGLAAESLAADEPSLLAAARGILTTDTREKVAARELTIGARNMAIAGMAKGAAMIGPNMATMLGLMMTDARLTPAAAQSLLADVADQTFNCISVEGHMSTNDTVLLLANGAAGGAPLDGDDLARFHAGLLEVASELARAIPADGEGATHLVVIDVTGCATRASARQIAKTVAESALVKCAIAGADPNWGRIVSAAGYAGVPFDADRVCLRVNGVSLYENGAPVDFDRSAVSRSLRDDRETRIALHFGEGSGKIRFWTTDLTAEYVRLNADYFT